MPRCGRLQDGSIRWLALVAGTIALVGDLACSREAVEPVTPPSHSDEESSTRIALSPAELAEFGVELGVAGAGVIATTVELPGEIRPNGDLVAHIVPRFPGIVRSVGKSIGDPVARGDTLATIESSESLSLYGVQSLLAGVVIARHVSVGESVSSDREIFVVADLAHVWVDFQAFQKQLPLLAVGQRVHITAGHLLPEAEALISYLAPVVDEATRTATVRAVVPNVDGRWRPGLFVTGRVETLSVEVEVAIPLTAVQRIGEVPVVFVQTDGGFEPRPIRIGRAGPHRLEVVGGLRPGERFVSEGSFVLKAEFERGQLSDGHGH